MTDLVELAQEVIKYNYFHWVTGMRAIGRDIDGNHASGVVWLTAGQYSMPTIIDEDGNIAELRWAYPDLKDSATLGCIQSLARSAHNDPYLYASTDGEEGLSVGWWVKNSDDNIICCFPETLKEQNREKYGRCCAGGPCFLPSWGKTEAEAWAITLSAKNK